MPVEVYMPKMSDHMEFGVIVEWLVAEGARVDEGQGIVEVETDKMTATIEAPARGFLKGIRRGAEKGMSVPVGETIAFIVKNADEGFPSLPLLVPGLSEGAAKEDRGTETRECPPKPDASLLAAKPSQHRPIDPNGLPGSGPGGETRKEDVQGRMAGAGVSSTPGIPERVKASPAARRRSRELGIDIRQVPGTGPDGWISEKDVESYLPAGSASGAEVSAGESGQLEWLELSPVQRITGERMRQSVVTIPQFVLDSLVDVERLLAMREGMMEEIISATGRRLSLTTLLAKIVAVALRRFPRANCEFEQGRIRLHRDVNVGIALAGKEGLIVPVIRNADRKDLAQINSEMKVFTQKAEDMRFSADDLAGGHFTISNLGMYGIDRFQAIINPPQSAILAVGRIMKLPVGTEDGTVVLRPVINLTLSVDHRSMDGMQAAQFLNMMKGLVERPSLFLGG